MLPYLMTGSLIAGFVTAWLQSHNNTELLPVSDRILKMRQEGEQPNEPHTIHPSGVDTNINPNPVPVRRMLPVISWVQAGHWTTAETVLRNLPQETPTLPDIADAGPNAFWLQVQGISNYPEYRHGEYICIDPDWQIDELQTGDMIVATCMGDATFKQLVVEPDGSRYLKALNPDWRPQIMPIGEDCLLVGLVVAKYALVKRRR